MLVREPTKRSNFVSLRSQRQHWRVINSYHPEHTHTNIVRYGQIFFCNCCDIGTKTIIRCFYAMRQWIFSVLPLNKVRATDNREFGVPSVVSMHSCIWPPIFRPFLPSHLYIYAHTLTVVSLSFLWHRSNNRATKNGMPYNLIANKNSAQID